MALLLQKRGIFDQEFKKTPKNYIYIYFYIYIQYI